MICKMDGCEGKAIGRGLCGKHYKRFQNHGDPNIVLKTRKRSTRTSCEKCGKQEHKAKGLCRTCYYDQNKGPKKERKPRNTWSQDDLEYIAKYCDLEKPNVLALGLGKKLKSVEEKIDELKRTGELQKYKRSYERRLEA